MTMHLVSGSESRRPGYFYDKFGIGYPEASRPKIRWHIDGPVLYLRNGQVHFLTLRERLRVWVNLDDATSLEAKLRPDLVPKD